MKMSILAGIITSEDWLLLSRKFSPFFSLHPAGSIMPPFTLFPHPALSSLSFRRLIFYLCSNRIPKLLFLSTGETEICSARKAKGAFSSVFIASAKESHLNEERLRFVSNCWQEVTFSCSVEDRSIFSFSGFSAAIALFCLTAGWFLSRDLDLESRLSSLAALERE